MAASDNLMTMMEPCTFRSTFSDSWFSDIMFQKSLSPPVQTSTGSGRTGSACSENETTGSNRGSIISTNSKVVGVKGKITKKKKSRASRKNTTTYITADVDNFRHMVQQVTGGNGHVAFAPPLLKPEPQRAVVNRLQPVSCCLPTLDTSAFLLDHVASQQQMVGPTSTPPPDMVVGGGSSCGGFDFSSFSGFPTLESWKAI